ncbi:transcriptional regulator [Pseudomonas sp. TNT2022 ID357]|uniref:Transcriptional regulator n=1 Tax=Pseudomonas idahonensis TaxID=2942628 RepID=A0ABT5PXQ5_9PSED|nr:transcriptional regulator [Pseudomonas idahonensis]MDD1146711.1 transcriptional regulator [Pseudomonas idahonensis]
MHPNTTPPSKGLIRQPALCQWLDVTRSGLAKLRAKDPSFPKPIKDGDSRQAAAYYVVTEIDTWLRSKITARDNVQGRETEDSKL